MSNRESQDLGDHNRREELDRSVSPFEEDDSRLSIPNFSEPPGSFELIDYTSDIAPSYSPDVKQEIERIPDNTSLGNQWQSGIWARMPWTGIVAILTNILCTLASVVVLVVSNNAEIDKWSQTLQPSVWLSATSTLANLSLQLAFAEAINVAFWRSAGRGSTLKDLHIFASGTSLITALQGIFKLKGISVAMACVLITVSTFRSPIVQKASSVAQRRLPTSGEMILNVAQQLSAEDHALGVSTSSDNTISYLTSEFSNILRSYTARSNIVTDTSVVVRTEGSDGCENSCKGSVKGFGFKPTCFSGTSPFDGSNSTLATQSATVFQSSVLFNYNISLGAPNTQFMMNSTFLDGGLEADSISWHNCTMELAIVEYAVTISQNFISLSNTTNYFSISQQAIPHSNYGAYSQRSVGTIVAGFGYYLSSVFDSNSELKFLSDGLGVQQLRSGNWSLESTGMTANQNMNLGGGTAWSISLNSSWNDPMDDMLDQANSLAFRVAVQMASNDLTSNSTQNAQNVTYSGTRTAAVYSSNFDIMGIAIALNLLALVSLLPMYYGWWELGRKSTLGVLETAKAFGAPLLKDIDDNATTEQILRRVGKKRVVYGEASVSARSSGASQGFLVPRKELRGRLQIVDEGGARKPRNGMSFAFA